MPLLPGVPVVGAPHDPLAEATAALHAALDPADVMAPSSLAVTPC